MKRFLTLLSLLLCAGLAAGSACAEIPGTLKAGAYAEQGVGMVSFDDYDGDISPEVKWSCDIGTGLFTCEARLSESIQLTGGILAQTEWDLDGDGDGEWLVLRGETFWGNYGKEPGELYLAVYEVEGDTLALVDEAEVTMFFGRDYISLALYDLDGAPALLLTEKDYIANEHHSATVYAYRDGELKLLDSLLIYGGDECTGIFTFFDPLDLLDTLTGSLPRWGLKSVPELDALRADAEAAEDRWNHPALYYGCVIEPVAPLKTLFVFDDYYRRWDDPTRDDARCVQLALPTVATTGSVNLRSAPSLDGESVAKIAEGEVLALLGGVETDDRGVDWYAVRWKDRDLWVSSKFAEVR